MTRVALVAVAFIAVLALAAPPVTRAAACQKRFKALCEVMQRCSVVTEDLGGPQCEAIDPGCTGLQGKASYDDAAVEECVAGLKKVTCEKKVDPNDPEFDFEAKVPACRKLAVAADAGP